MRQVLSPIASSLNAAVTFHASCNLNLNLDLGFHSLTEAHRVEWMIDYLLAWLSFQALAY